MVRVINPNPNSSPVLDSSTLFLHALVSLKRLYSNLFQSTALHIVCNRGELALAKVLYRVGGASLESRDKVRPFSSLCFLFS